jgi:hypothetical protein
MLRLARTVLKCVLCICNHCDVLVRGLPAGAEDEEGFDVGDKLMVPALHSVACQ